MNDAIETFLEWEVRSPASGKDLRIFPKGAAASSGCLCSIPIRDGRKPLAIRAAALIAAAPRLLAALEVIVQEVDGRADISPYSADSYLPKHVMDMANAAIGRTHAN